MSSFYTYILIFCAVWLLQGCADEREYQQEHLKEWPVVAPKTTSYGYIYNDEKVRYGFILTKNNDTLRGRMKILPYYGGGYHYILLLPEGKNSGKDILAIDRKHIRYVRAYDDSVNRDSAYMDFVNLDDKDLWRVLVTKDSIAIYDDYTPAMGSAFGYEMILIGMNKERIQIYHHHYHDYSEDISPEILQFINRRYKTHFAAGDFKDAWAMIHYILDKEAK